MSVVAIKEESIYNIYLRDNSVLFVLCSYYHFDEQGNVLFFEANGEVLSKLMNKHFVAPCFSIKAALVLYIAKEGHLVKVAGGRM